MSTAGTISRLVRLIENLVAIEEVLMNSLPVRILAAVLTFILGVGLANLWLTTPSINPVACRFPVGTRPAQLEMVFVIDTTGSMGGLLDAAKQRIWGIVNGA